MKHQLYFAEQKGFKWAFFSRDRNRRVVESISRQLTKETGKKWLYCSEKIAVCYPAAPSCWQWVAYHAISENKKKWGMIGG